MAINRVALAIEYDGTDFIGWQRQPAGRSVQAELEHALAIVADEPVSAVCAGRTDRGVHAVCQIVHFDTTRTRAPRNWMLGANANLPPDVSALWACAAPGDFHARFSACARVYRYLIRERATRPALARNHVAWTHRVLDADRMREAAACLVGEHDFSAFRGADCQAHSPVRTIARLGIERRGGVVCVEVKANAFLQHMVRNIVGSLLIVGWDRKSAYWLAEVLHGRDRRHAGPTAPACGLSLVGVVYPSHYGLPAGPDAALAIGDLAGPLSYDERQVCLDPDSRPDIRGAQSK